VKVPEINFLIINCISDCTNNQVSRRHKRILASASETENAESLILH
jgi:hypothetical protein